MATETGIASNYKDLLNRLRLFATGLGSPTSGLTWAVERYNTAQPTADNPLVTQFTSDQTFDELILRGNGGTSPEQSIYFGIATYGNSGSGNFGWQVRAFTGYTDTSPQTPFLDQPGRSPPCYVPLQNASMEYWFVGSERRLMAVIKTGTAYQFFHAGFINAFATAGEYPYPMLVAGSAFTFSFAFNNNDVAFASLPHPGGDSATALPVGQYPSNRASGWLREVDGNWYPVKNFYASSGRDQHMTQPYGVRAWPMTYPMASDWPAENSQIGWNYTFFRGLFLQTTPGNTPVAELQQAFGSPRLTTLWPCTLLDVQNSAILGEVDGLFWCSATGGLTSEDTITDSGESPEVEFIVFQNVHRTDPWMYYAVRND